MNLQEVIAANQTTRARADELNIRAGGLIFFVMDRDELATWLASRLNGARSLAEVKDPSALLLPPLPQETVDRVLAENPDTINLCGSTYPVQYQPLYGDDDLHPPRVSLPLGDYIRVWRDLPDEGVFLPGGKRVEVGVGFPEHHSTLFSSDIPQLKSRCAARLNESAWFSWQQRQDRPIIPLPDPADPASMVSEIIECSYGTSVLDGTALMAFGVAIPRRYRYDQADPWFEGAWYQTRAEAERARDKSVAYLETERATATLQKKVEEMRRASTATQRALGQLLDHADWPTFSLQRADLSQRVTSYAYSHIPLAFPDDLEKWLREAQAIADETKKALNAFSHARSQAATRVQVSTSVSALQAKFSGGRQQQRRR